MTEAMRVVGRILARSLYFVGAATMVVAGLVLLLGPPTANRTYHENALVRFHPTVGRGLVQLIGEAGLLTLITYAGRRWLRIRL